MGSNELSLDYKPNGDMTLPKNLEDQSDQAQKLQQFLARLEHEHVKIDAFKRELPLCMQLLNNAMEVCRQQLGVGNGGGGGEKPVMEEFIPTKQSCTDDDSRPSEKVNWLASVQLWSQTNEVSPKRWSGGAFLPFSKEKGSNYCGGGSDLAIVPVEEKKRSSETLLVEEMAEKCKNSNVENSSGTQSVPPAVAGGGQSQTHRKARRCWSPDLHRRFVNALQVLGGSQVATPKQIRELMKVDGLTNDEVKSHLQKYRLHTRRPIPATPQTAVAAGPPQLVVLGGIWVPQEYATSATVYSTHPSNGAQFCTTAGPPVSHGFYSPPPHPNANHQGGTARYKGGQQGAVECNVKGSGEGRVESTEEEEEEERKSGSSSSDGGGDESNGSEVTLKF